MRSLSNSLNLTINEAAQSWFAELGLVDLSLLAFSGDIRLISLLMGMCGLVAGLALLLAHKSRIDNVLESEKSERLIRFERRKYRRRALASSLIASVGGMLAALYWVTDPKVFSIFILVILALLVCILMIAFFDLFSVGLQELTRTDSAADRQAIEEFLQKRRKAAFEEPDDNA